MYKLHDTRISSKIGVLIPVKPAASHRAAMRPKLIYRRETVNRFTTTYIGRKEENAMRVGIGYDIHKLVEGRPLVLGGVTIPFDQGLEGHSDADVLCHAICDALLGAAGEGDIGLHFPDTDPRYKDIDSIYLLSQVYKIIRDKGFSVINIDATVLAESPKLQSFREAMQQNIAEAVATASSRVNVKATTMEGLGSVGKKEGIAAICTALITSR